MRRTSGEHQANTAGIADDRDADLEQPDTEGGGTCTL